MRRHLVEFLSPGTFVDETSAKPIPKWDTRKAMAIAETIRERHNARPYGFRFLTQLVADPIADGEGGTLRVEPRTIKESGTHYIAGKVLRYDDIPDTDDNRILRSNMRCNRWPLVCETRNSWRHTGIFRPDDVVVDMAGNVLERGDSPELIAYRNQMIADWDK